MMVPILNEQERARLLQTLRDEPAFREEMRTLLLGQELIELPQRFAEFSAFVLDFIAEQKLLNALIIERLDGIDHRLDKVDRRFDGIDHRLDKMDERFDGIDHRLDKMDERFDGIDHRLDKMDERFDGIDHRLDKMDERFDGMDERFDGMDERFDGMDERFDGIDQKLQRMTDDIGVLKGSRIQQILQEYPEHIMNMLGLNLVDILNRRQKINLIYYSERDRFEDVDTSVKRSFCTSDMILESRDATGNTHYVTVEASFTADRRDSDRAIRNAELITRATGDAASAMVASVNNDHYIQSLVADGSISWLQLSEHELQPD